MKDVEIMVKDVESQIMKDVEIMLKDVEIHMIKDVEIMLKEVQIQIMKDVEILLKEVEIYLMKDVQRCSKKVERAFTFTLKQFKDMKHQSTEVSSFNLFQHIYRMKGVERWKLFQCIQHYFNRFISTLFQQYYFNKYEFQCISTYLF